MYYAVRIAAAAVLAAAALLTLALARADFYFQRRTPESVAKAVNLAPGNSEYLQLRALQLEYDGSDPSGLLRRAAELSPMSSAPRIRLGLSAESAGDFQSAEKWLLDAAAIDKQFETRWTLANFYFRRGDAAQFWKWIGSALEISYGDRRPAFDLCWRISDDASAILRAIPERQETLSAYVSYLLETNRSAAAGDAAIRLASMQDGGDRDPILAAVDALIAARSADAAWNLWRAAGFHDPVTFESPRVGSGFDWQRLEVPGVAHLEIDQPRPMHRIGFRGNQPESCEVLRRVWKLEPGRRYTLRWQFDPEIAGVEWRIAGERASLKDRELRFTAASELETLSLFYRRPQGEIRAEGALELWSVEIE